MQSLQNSFSELLLQIKDTQISQQFTPDTLFNLTLKIFLSHQSQNGVADEAMNILHQKGWLSENALRQCSVEEILQILSPVASLQRQVQRVKKLLDILFSQGVEFEDLRQFSDSRLREFLHSVPHLGLEICDQILLYVFGRTTFPVNLGLHRIFMRHRMVFQDDDYFSVQDYCLAHLPTEIHEIQTIHQKLKTVAKTHCAKSNPDCAHCPLKFLNGGFVLETQI